MQTFATIGKQNHSVNHSELGGSLYDTPFLLKKEPGNKFKVNDVIEQTVGVSSEIPFLRPQHNAADFSKTWNGAVSFGPGASRAFSASAGKRRVTKSRQLKRNFRKECNWNNYIKPISTYNT